MADAKLAASLVRMRQRRTGPLILELDLTDGITEGPPADPLSALLPISAGPAWRTCSPGCAGRPRPDRVHVLVVKVGGSRIGLAKIQELRAAIGDFRQSGKLAVAWSESFGDFVQGNLPYYLASGFDRIYLQPSGTLGLTGVAVEQVFLHGALEKLGIDFQSAKRCEYKSAADQLTESGFTGPSREAAARLAESVTEQLAGAVAAGRGLTVERATELLRRGPFVAATGPRRRAGRRAAVPGRGLRPGPQGEPGRTRHCSTCSATSAPSHSATCPSGLAAPLRRSPRDAASSSSR